MYESKGFRVTNIDADPEFLYIKNEILPSQLSIAAANERVGETERSVRTTKKVSRCTAQPHFY